MCHISWEIEISNPIQTVCVWINKYIKKHIRTFNTINPTNGRACVVQQSEALSNKIFVGQRSDSHACM